MAITAPDVATIQPDATPAPAPDLTPVTGAPANPAAIPAPAGAAVVPSEYTGNAAPQAQPAPERPANNGIKAGFSSAFPQFGPDANGNIVQSNPTPRNFKGILGSVLGGALRGAAFGMAAEKGESGAAAAQRLSEQAKLQAQTEAQRNLENQNALKRQKLQEALQTAEAVRSQKRLEMDKEMHDALMQDHGVNSQILAAHLHDIKEGQANAESSWHAMMAEHDHAPLHGDVKNDNDTYIDTEGKLHSKGSDTTGETTPGVAGTSAGSAANLKGAGAKSAIAKLTTHAPNIANGNLMVTQNGELGQNSGFKLYENAKLDDIITKPAYFQTPTTMKHPDGTPVMQDHVIMPDGKTTFRTTREMLNGAEADVKAKTDQMIKTYELQNKALEPAKTAAETNKANQEAYKAHAEGVAANAGGPGGTGTAVPPAGYTPPPMNELMTTPIGDLQRKLKTMGAPDAPYLGTLVNVARYDTPLEKAFTNTKRKGVTQTDRELAVDYITKWLNPQFREGESKGRVDYLSAFTKGTNGDGAAKTRMNTAISHLGLIGEASRVLANGSSSSNLPFLNSLAGKFGVATGDDPVVVYNAIANKAAGELAGAIKGGSGGATDQEIEIARKGFDYALSQHQQASWLRTQAQLIDSARQTLRNNFIAAMGVNPEDTAHSIVYPENKKILDTWVNSGPGATGAPSLPGGANTSITPAAQSYLNNR